jgi:hypothetical protein
MKLRISIYPFIAIGAILAFIFFGVLFLFFKSKETKYFSTTKRIQPQIKLQYNGDFVDTIFIYRKP